MALTQTVLLALNTGVLNSVTASIDVSNFFDVGFQVIEATGTIAGAVVTLQTSVDNTNWFSTSITVSAEGAADTTTSFQWIRFIVSTASTIASTADVTVERKDRPVLLINPQIVQSTGTMATS